MLASTASLSRLHFQASSTTCFLAPLFFLSLRNLGCKNMCIWSTVETFKQRRLKDSQETFRRTTSLPSTVLSKGTEEFLLCMSQIYRHSFCQHVLSVKLHDKLPCHTQFRPASQQCCPFFWQPLWLLLGLFCCPFSAFLPKVFLYGQPELLSKTVWRFKMQIWNTLQTFIAA